MKRWLGMFAVLIIGVGIVAPETSLGQPGSKDGPGDGGAVLKLPDLNVPAAPGVANPPLPAYLKYMDKPAASPFPSPPAGGRHIAEPPSNNVNINKDIEVTPQAGPWMIMVMSYSGPKAPKMARNFHDALRSTYRLNSYVWNYGAEEKRKEYERVQKIRQEQIDALVKSGLLKPGQTLDMPIRVPTMKIDEYTGVLVGGYRTFDEASKARKIIKELDPQPLKGRVDLDYWFISKSTPSTDLKRTEKVELPGLGFVNPFSRAFVCRNPSLPKEQAASTAAEDLRFLRKINEDEPFSLLKCKQPFTLAIKQFNVQAQKIRNKEGGKGFLDNLDIFKSRPWEDMTAHNAHNLAEGLRKSGLKETYVLHCKYCSYVTVGGFGPNDPRMLGMQETLERLFRMDAYRPFDMFPRPVPMPVPGVGLK